MAVYRVFTPAAGFNGPRAGVQFRDGVAVVDTDDEMQARALAYFYRRGYRVELRAEQGDQAGGHRPSADPPAQSAPKADWVAWAVAAFGLTQEEAEALTKADLIARYGQ